MGRPKKESTAETVVEAKVGDKKSTEVETKKEVEKIVEKKSDESEQIAKLQAQIELLMKAQMSMGAPIEQPKKKKKMIKIVSLVTGGLTLQGSRVIYIPKQFDSVTVTDSEARIIISNMPESARSGLFYITDREFIEENELEDAYTTILSDEQLRELLNRNVDEVVEIYKNSTDRQKEIINTMIIDGRLNGTRIDANLVQELSQISGIDFMGIDKIED